jgi:hypothetical protein
MLNEKARFYNTVSLIASDMTAGTTKGAPKPRSFLLEKRVTTETKYKKKTVQKYRNSSSAQVPLCFCVCDYALQPSRPQQQPQICESRQNLEFL